ncbi:MAG: BrxA/BrxB family bacilliredoxin [Gemmatimonadetes bacterium]|nr:BrxA/BrxB family bacilliredoxin [Gemmatimonadota bacterium]NNM34585.1 BrxA/BrxB family bacilliredoxin [Gemmatimonadota bacterium]
MCSTMPYPEMMVAPMREDLVRLGFQELRTPEQVSQAMEAMDGTIVLAVNSVCGCAAGAMRPAVMMAMEHEKLPDHRLTVFAGQDVEATAEARKHLVGYPPSSPSIALMKGGEVVYMMERFMIEGRSAPEIAEDLKAAFNEHC